MSNKHDFPICYDVQVTEDNVSNRLSHEIMRLMYCYGSRVKDSIDCIALGPNSYKCLEAWGHKNATYSCRWRHEYITFEGVKIVCGALPFIQILFKPDGWYYAHEEAKRFINQTGGADA